KRGAVSRPDSKSKNRRRRSESGTGKNVYRSIGHDPGENAGKSDKRRVHSVTQRAFQFTDGVCRSCAGSARRCYAAGGCRRRAEAGAAAKVGGTTIAN